MKPITKFVIAAFAATAATSVFAQQDSRYQGYLADSSGQVVRNGSNELCWRHTDPDSPLVQPSCEVAAPVAAAQPAPQPAVIAAAPAAIPVPASQKISFSGDALFAFDSAVLKPEGKVMLDGLVGQLQGASYDTIHATGHTDRFGSNAYNQKLSQRRAETVKAYLLSKNVNASRIDADGKGETQPVTKASDCRGAVATTKVKACLQPDRRVDIEMRGTKTVAASQ
ncbi:MAG TPA: OmpA family protein [Burkholderiales bacterium]